MTERPLTEQEPLTADELAALQHELDTGSAYWDQLLYKDVLQSLVSMASGLVAAQEARNDVNRLMALAAEAIDDLLPAYVAWDCFEQASYYRMDRLRAALQRAVGAVLAGTGGEDA